jgi:hypothetical protein
MPRQLLRALTALRRPASGTTPLPIVDRYGRRIVTGLKVQRGQIVRDECGERWFVGATSDRMDRFLIDGKGHMERVSSTSLYVIEEDNHE